MARDARTVFDALTDAVNRHDRSAIATCYAPDVTVVTPDGTFTGREAAAAMIHEFIDAFPDLHGTSWSKVTSGDMAVDEFTLEGTNTGPIATPEGESIPPTGRTLSLRCIDVGVIRDGQIVSHRVYWDQLDLLTQLGLAGQPETATA